MITVFPIIRLRSRNWPEAINVQKQAKFIGFIPKEDLEKLIVASLAIIQPSLFEGWSTVIEESKQYNKYLIASDIAIHFEQMENYPNKIFFSKSDPLDLSEKIRTVLTSGLNIQDYSYEKDIETFAKNFLQIL